MSRAKQTALVIAKQIEKASGNSLGDLSLDLGVDTAGQLWFFEANSKPMKFDEPHIRKKSLTNLIQYCIHLSKLTAGKQGQSASVSKARKKTIKAAVQKGR